MKNHLQSYYNFLMMHSQKDTKIHLAMQSRYFFKRSSSHNLLSTVQITILLGLFGRGGERNIC